PAVRVPVRGAVPETRSDHDRRDQQAVGVGRGRGLPGHGLQGHQEVQGVPGLAAGRVGRPRDRPRRAAALARRVVELGLRGQGAPRPRPEGLVRRDAHPAGIARCRGREGGRRDARELLPPARPAAAHVHQLAAGELGQLPHAGGVRVAAPPRLTRDRMPAALLAGALLVASSAAAQGEDEGRRQYERLCASCHGADGNGGERGPAIAARLFTRGDDALLALVRDGLPAAGMPGLRIPDPEARALLAFLRTLRPRRGAPPERVSLETTDRRALSGIVLNRTPADMQVLSDDRRLHLLRREGERWRRVTSQADWPSYHGRLDGNRWSALVQIDKTNLNRLAP